MSSPSDLTRFISSIQDLIDHLSQPDDYHESFVADSVNLLNDIVYLLEELAAIHCELDKASVPKDFHWTPDQLLKWRVDWALDMLHRTTTELQTRAKNQKELYTAARLL